MAENLPTEDEIIGTSLYNLKELVIQHADEGKNVLLLGPRGSGKDLFARLYQEGTRRRKFAPVNCSGIRDSALISELFGHKKGSFTGATDNRSGLLSTYGKDGVIFLDEIGDASQSFQAALLRVLETGDYKPFGSDKFGTLSPDEMRIIAATTKTDNVRPEIKDRFVTLYIPGLPVLINKGDLPELIKEFCQDPEVKYISQDALKILEEYLWPGNVRQLKGVLENAIELCKIEKSEKIQIDYLPTITEYLESHIDNSEITKISELPSNSKSYPHRIFYLPVMAGKREELIPEEGTLLRLTLNSIDSSISQGFRGIQGAIDDISHSESKERSKEKINFENTTPYDYNKRFWEHHAKLRRGGTKLASLFNGKIKTSTASANLQKAKERLNESQGEKSDK